MSGYQTQRSSFFVIFAIIISFFLAAMLNVYPLTFRMAMIRPMILIMVLIFWLMFQPKYVGVFIAFFIGLLADLILDTRLGQQAFCAVVVALFIKMSMSFYVKRLNTFSAWLFATICLIIFQVNLWILQYLTQNLFVFSSFWSLLMSILCYPLVLILLHRYSQ